MKICHYCNHENKDTARFCVKCGKSLEKLCPKCGCALEEDEVFCPQCGCRLDGKINCPKCGAENEGEDVYCFSCGESLKAAASGTVINAERGPNPYSARQTVSPAVKNAAPKAVPKAKKDSKKALDRVLSICRASLILVFALVMFIMSFMSVTKVSAPADIDEAMGLDGMSEAITVDVSSIDIIEGAFLRLDPKSSEETLKDFLAYAMDHLSKKDLAFLDGISSSSDSSASDAVRALKIVTGLIEDYNVLKFVSVKEVSELTPSADMEMWICAAMSFLYIGLTLAFFIAAIVDFIAVLRGQNKTGKTTVALCAFALAAAAGLGFLSNLIFDGSTGYGVVTFLVFALLSVVGGMAYRIYAGEIRFSMKKIPRYISLAAGTALAVVLVCLACSSLIKIDCQCTATNSTGAASSLGGYRGSYNASALAAAWNSLRLASQNPEMVGSAETYIPSIFQSYGGSQPFSSILNEEMLHESLSPALMGILGTVEVEKALAAIGIVIELLCVAVIVTLSLSFADRIRAVHNDRDGKFVYSILALCLSVALLIFGIVYASLVNSTVEELKNITYTAKISGIAIAAVVFAAISLIQQIVCRVLVKKSEKTENEAA